MCSRGSLHLLLKPDNLRREEDSTRRKNSQRSVTTLRERKNFGPPLGRRESKGEIPAVGTYTLDSSLIKKTFSTYKPKAIPKISLKTPEKRPTVAVSQPKLRPFFAYSIKKQSSSHQSTDKFDILRPEIAVEQTKRTNFHVFRIADSPDDIAKSLELKERRKIKEERLGTIKEIAQKLAQRPFE